MFDNISGGWKGKGKEEGEKGKGKGKRVSGIREEERETNHYCFSHGTCCYGSNCVTGYVILFPTHYQPSPSLQRRQKETNLQTLSSESSTKSHQSKLCRRIISLTKISINSCC